MMSPDQNRPKISVVETLNPERIEAYHQRMMAAAQRLGTFDDTVTVTSERFPRLEIYVGDDFSSIFILGKSDLGVRNIHIYSTRTQGGPPFGGTIEAFNGRTAQGGGHIPKDVPVEPSLLESLVSAIESSKVLTD